MSSNKTVRRNLEKLFGKRCMLEASGIRYVPRHERIRIKGYKKIQEEVTYHHLIKKEYGGKATIENGALLKRYNHDWLHTLPIEQQEQVNNRLREFKLSLLEIGYEETKKRIISGEISFSIPNLEDESVDYITIKAYKNKEIKKGKKAEYAREAIEALEL